MAAWNAATLSSMVIACLPEKPVKLAADCASGLVQAACGMTLAAVLSVGSLSVLAPSLRPALPRRPRRLPFAHSTRQFRLGGAPLLVFRCLATFAAFPPATLPRK